MNHLKELSPLAARRVPKRRRRLSAKARMGLSLPRKTEEVLLRQGIREMIRMRRNTMVMATMEGIVELAKVVKIRTLLQNQSVPGATDRMTHTRGCA